MAPLPSREALDPAAPSGGATTPPVPGGSLVASSILARRKFNARRAYAAALAEQLETKVQWPRAAVYYDALGVFCSVLPESIGFFRPSFPEMLQLSPSAPV